LNALTLHNVNGISLLKLLMVLMGFPRLGAAYFTKTGHECTQRQLRNMRDAWYVSPQSRPLDSGDRKGRLQVMSYPEI
jgi:hypothetical protein